MKKLYKIFSKKISETTLYCLLIAFMALNFATLMFPSGDLPVEQWSKWTHTAYAWLILTVIFIIVLLAATIRRINTPHLKWPTKTICILLMLCGALAGLFIPITYCTSHYYGVDILGITTIISLQAILFSLSAIITRRVKTYQHNKTLSINATAICLLLLSCAFILFCPECPYPPLVIIITLAVVLIPVYRGKRKLIVTRNQIISGVVFATLILGTVIFSLALLALWDPVTP
jgi:hypothetical protein